MSKETEAVAQGCRLLDYVDRFMFVDGKDCARWTLVEGHLLPIDRPDKVIACFVRGKEWCFVLESKNLLKSGQVETYLGLSVDLKRGTWKFDLLPVETTGLFGNRVVYGDISLNLLSEMMSFSREGWKRKSVAEAEKKLCPEEKFIKVKDAKVQGRSRFPVGLRHFVPGCGR